MSARAGEGAGRAGPVLQGSEVRLRMALEAAGMVTWEWDLGTGSIRYSDNVPEIARGDETDPYHTVAGLLQSIHPEDRDGLARALQTTVERGIPFECEYRVRMLDGRYRWILGKGKSVLVEGGKPVRVLGISQDITARKEAEGELHRRSRELAELASELIMVENRERRRLADLLHEQVQQLLVGARIQIHALLAGEKGRKRDQLNVLRRLVEEVLDLSRSITRDLAPPTLPQKDVASALAWLGQDMRERHRLAVAVRTDAGLPESGEAASVLLFTAARELLLNVAKHAGARKAEMHLRRRADFVELEIIDKGKGFDPTKIEKAGGHGGFGLFSIRERAELLGGRLTVNSARGRGTRVLLALPVAHREVGHERGAGDMKRVVRRRKSGAGPDAAAARPGKVIRVVVADDHPAVRQGIIGMLRGAAGCEIVGEAENGKAAVECVERLRPDVVVMDVSMPVMDGIEATRIITKRWPAVSVIGLSMHESPSVAKEMRAAGAFDYVPKTAKPERVVDAIRACAAGRRLAAGGGRGG